jgi:hypothetical protein
MHIRMLRPVLALTLILSLILIASVPASAQWPPFSGGMRQIPSGQYYVIKDFIAKGPQASITFEVQLMGPTGSSVDLLLMSKYSFEQYKSGATFFTYDVISKLDVSSASGSVGFPDLLDGNEYFLVIDNTDRPIGGGQGNDEVQVMYFFEGTDIQTVGEWTAILIILVVLVVAAVAIIIVVFVLLRKSKSKGSSGPQSQGQQNQMQGMRTCPYCGTQASTRFAYCPKCGNRF